MKNFIIKVIGYGLACFIVGLIILASARPGSIYAYPPLVAKLEYLRKHPEYNLYFIGSSKINNQINPQIIDGILPNTRSYNLGANGGFNLENYQVVEQILNNAEYKPNYIVLELQEKSKLTKTNLYSTRSFGMFDFNNTKYNTEYYYAEQNYKQVLLSIFSFVLNVFHYDKTANLKDVRNFTNQTVTQKSGFASLDSTQKRRTPKDKLEKEIARRLNIYNSDHNAYTPNPIFVEKIRRISETCAKRKIKLILLIPAPAEPDAKRLNIYQDKCGVPVINLVRPKDSPQFYQYQNRWDYGHLNERGANLMSELVGNSLKHYTR